MLQAYTILRKDKIRNGIPTFQAMLKKTENQNLANAMPEIVSPIDSEEVAAGEGALRT